MSREFSFWCFHFCRVSFSLSTPMSTRVLKHERIASTWNLMKSIDWTRKENLLWASWWKFSLFFAALSCGLIVGREEISRTSQYWAFLDKSTEKFIIILTPTVSSSMAQPCLFSVMIQHTEKFCFGFLKVLNFFFVNYWLLMKSHFPPPTIQMENLTLRLFREK